jgi:hypothetical protein
VLEKPVFIQGIFAFEGRGLSSPVAFSTPVGYAIPSDKRAQTIYLRAGNPASELICLMLTRNGKTMRYFPVGAKGAIHVALAVLEDLSPGSTIEILVGAPAGMKSEVVVDVGFMEIV